MKFTEFRLPIESTLLPKRPYEVEIGLIEDYIKRSLIITDDIVIG